MPLDLQAKLLRVLQDQVIYRVGGTSKVQLDVRILAASNEDLQGRVREGTFRNDLYYRLNVVPLLVPPLRERPADIIPLALAFLRRSNSQYHTGKLLALESQQVLQEYTWPGNVRELENLIERLVVMTPEDIIGAREVRLALGLGGGKQAKVLPPDQLPSLPEACAALERDLLARALARYRTAREVARALCISHPTVIKKTRQYGLPAPWADKG